MLHTHTYTYIYELIEVRGTPGVRYFSVCLQGGLLLHIYMRHILFRLSQRNRLREIGTKSLRLHSLRYTIHFVVNLREFADSRERETYMRNSYTNYRHHILNIMRPRYETN